MKQAISQESVSDSGHSYSSSESEQTSASKVKSAAMLGIALSVGASGALVATAEASAAVSAPTVSDTTKAFSSESKASSASESSQAASQVAIVTYHTVESGESLWQIAQQHQVGLQALKVANELPPETSIRVGQVLRVPGNNAGIEIEIESTPAVDQAAQSVEEDASPTAEPTLVAQSVKGTSPESTVESDAQAHVQSQLQDVQLQGAEILRLEAVGGEAPSIEIEIADASTQVSAQSESAPVVTALAATQSFSSYQIQAGDTIAS